MNKKISAITLKIIILSIIFGSLSGILGFILVAQNDFFIPIFGSVNFDNLSHNQRLVIEQPRNVVVDQDIRLKQIENDLLPTMLGIYSVQNERNIINQVYLDSEMIGQGFVLTADGWVVTVADVVSDTDVTYDIVGYQNKEYEISDWIKDDTTGLIFGKMESKNLSVAKIGESQKTSVGQTVVVVSGRDNVNLAHITKIGKKYQLPADVVESSEDLNKEIFLDIDLSRGYQGAVVVNLKGEIVGLINGGKVVMSDYFSDIVPQILDKQEISRPILGIQYIDLSHNKGLIEIADKGAYVYANPLKSSPAYGQLKAEDIIKKVDGIELSASRGLSEMIATYDSGDIVELLIQRGEEEATVEITLQ